MIRRYAILLLALSAPVFDQPAIPVTPAGKYLSEWLGAFNSADPVRLLEFKNIYQREWTVEEMLDWRESTGGFALVRIEEQGPQALNAWVKENESDSAMLMEVKITALEPQVLGEIRLQPASLPPELAVPRLTEAQALAGLRTRVGQLAGDDKFSGALLVARNGKILLQQAWGDAQRAPAVPAAPDTQFRLGSMNKMFTSITTLQLVEAGKLSLDDAIGKHLADYPNKEVASQVTVRHLLTHKGGTGDIFGPEFEANRTSLIEHFAVRMPATP